MASCIFLVAAVFGQVSLPHMEHIYGGTVRQIHAVSMNTNETMVFACAESPRAMFWTEVNTDSVAIPCTWDILPDYESTYNHGVPSQFDVHHDSMRLFLADETEGLLSCDLSPNSLSTNLHGSFKSVYIEGDYLFAIGQTNWMGPPQDLMWYGTVNAAGTLTTAPSPLTLTTEGDVHIVHNPDDEYLYMISSMNCTSIYKSSDVYTNFSPTTSFFEIALPSPLDTWMGERRLGFGPDGKMFIGGQTNESLTVAIATSTNGATSFNVHVTGRESAGTTRGLNFEPVGSAGSYEVYYGIFVNTNNGWASGWADLPRGPGGWSETHVNMGAICADPNVPSILYMTTDQGTGISTNDGRHVYENNVGLTATHVSDLDLADTTKDIAWCSAKNGAWFTTNFTTTASWADANFPDGMGNSIDIDETDLTYQTVYCGSRRVHMTTNAGSNWHLCYTPLASEGASPGIDDGWVAALEANSNLVFAGFQGYDHEAPGGMLAWSTNFAAPGSWSVITTNVDVADLLYSVEDSNDTYLVAYEYHTNTAPFGIYQFDPATASQTQVFTNEVHVTDLEDDPTGTVYAAAVTLDHYPEVYYADPGLTNWTRLTTNGLPQIDSSVGASDWIGPSLALGYNMLTNPVVYLALRDSIWFLDLNTNVWQSPPSMKYPDGACIHVIVWDDLLVGTSAGLYSMDMDFDGDGLSDVEETGTYNTDPTLADTDSDGLSDLEELQKYETDPNLPDSDGDGSLDGDEVLAGTSPTNAASIFEITSLDSGSSSSILQWTSVEGKKYGFWATTNMAGEFMQFDSNIVATPPVNIYTATPPASYTPVFFRISTE